MTKQQVREKSVVPVTIRLNLANRDNLFDPYSLPLKAGGTIDEYTRINTGIVEYLKREINHNLIKSKLTIEVTMPPGNNCEPVILKQLINQCIKKEIDCIVKANGRYKWIAGSLLFFGMLVFSIGSLSPVLKNIATFNELFVIVSWVLIWRAVEIFFFDRAENNSRKRKLLYIYFADYKTAFPGPGNLS